MSDCDLITRLMSEGHCAMAAVAKEAGVNAATAIRWHLEGRRGRNGALVRLEGFRLGGKLRSSRPALMRFLAALNESNEPTAPAPTPAARRREAAKASAELAELLGTKS